MRSTWRCSSWPDDSGRRRGRGAPGERPAEIPRTRPVSRRSDGRDAARRGRAPAAVPAATGEPEPATRHSDPGTASRTCSDAVPHAGRTTPPMERAAKQASASSSSRTCDRLGARLGEESCSTAILVFTKRNTCRAWRAARENGGVDAQRACRGLTSGGCPAGRCVGPATANRWISLLREGLRARVAPAAAAPRIASLQPQGE